MKIKQISNYFLILIILIALSLRIFALGSIPRGLQSDEASFLINSAAILETGKDEDGQSFPIYLNSLIDSKPALYSYLQIPFIKLFGSTTAASRMPSALIGTLSIYLFYLLIVTVFKNKKLALFSALLLAISPWHVMNSRATQEVILSLAFIIANLIFAYKIFYEKFSIKNLVLFFLTALGGMYVYHATKIVLLLFYPILALVSFINKKSEPSQKKSMMILSLLILFSFFITVQSALTRFSAIGLLNDDLPQALIFESTTKSTPYTPLIAIRAFYNKPIMYFKYFLETYLAHFDLNYLFTKGGATRRFIVPQHGLFYMFELLLIPLGIFTLIKKHNKELLPWILLVLISPIPAALTTEEIPSSIRAFTLIIPLILASAMGFNYLSELFHKKSKYLFYFVSAFVFAWSITAFIQQFFVMMPIQNTLYRSRSYEVVSEIIANEHENYNSLQFTSDLREMYIYLWQHNLISINEIQINPMARYSQSYSLGKFNFNRYQCKFENVVPNSLLIAPENCSDSLKNSYSVLKTANFDDGTPGFVLLTN